LALTSPTPSRQDKFPRAFPSFAPITNEAQLQAAIEDLYTDAQYLEAGAAAGQALLNAIIPLNSPNSTQELAADFGEIAAATSQDIFQYGAQILLNGFSGQDYVDIFNAYAFEVRPSTV